MSSIRKINFSDGFSTEVTPADTIVAGIPSFYIGTGVPSSGLGIDGDSYLDYANGNLYAKASGSWTVTGTISLPATQIINTPAGNISATDIQAAINELDTEKLDKTGGTITGSLTVSGDLTVDGTTTNINSTNLDVTDKNITVNNGGNDASSEGAGLTVERTGTDGSIIYADAATSKFKIGAAGAEVEVADISSAQTVINKSIDSDNNTITNIVNADIKSTAAIAGSKLEDDIVLPGTGAMTVPSGTTAQQHGTPTDAMLRFNTDTNSFEGYSSSAWSAIGGAGGGGLDIFHQENFETNGASTFTQGNNAAPDAVGTGTLDGTLSDETTSPISKTQSLKYVSGATSTNDFFIIDTDLDADLKQEENTMGVKFWVTNEFADGEIEFVALDQDDVVLTSILDVLETTTKATPFTTSFDIPSGTTGLRYGFRVVTGNNTKILLIDDLELTMNPYVYKDITNMTDWESFTPEVVGAGTITAAVGKRRRVGDSMEMEGSFISGSSTGVDFTLAVPSNEAIDVTKISGGNQNHLGTYIVTDGTDRYFSVVDNSGIFFSDASNNSVIFLSAHASSDGNMIKTDGNGILASGQGMTFRITIPIQGWSASTEHVMTPQKSFDSMVRLHTGNGAGSTNTQVRRFSNIALGNGASFSPIVSTQTDGNITVTDSATDGTEFTVNDSGLYTITYTDGHSSAANFGLSLNSTQLTTGITSITSADVLNEGSIPASFNSEVSWSGLLRKGDVVRAHASALSFTSRVYLTIAKIGFKSLSAVPIQKVAYLKDVKASGSSGGASTSGSWTTRDLSEVTGDTEIVSLDTGTMIFTFSSGEYLVESSSPAHQVEVHQSRLYNTTDSSVESYGTSEYSESGGGISATTRTSVVAKLVLTSSKSFRIEHRFSFTNAANTSLGGATSFGGDEVYTQVKITKLR